MAMLEKRKAALRAEGLLAPERKQPLPNLPAAIGSVTPPQGPVTGAFLHRLRNGSPREGWPLIPFPNPTNLRQTRLAVSGWKKYTTVVPIGIMTAKKPKQPEREAEEAIGNTPPMMVVKPQLVIVVKPVAFPRWR